MTEVADNETRRKPRRVWPWVILALVVGLFLIILIGALSIRAVGGRKWKETQARQALLLGRLTAATGEREPLAGGPGEEGNAWEEYLAVLAAIGKLPEAEGQAQADFMWEPRKGVVNPEMEAKRAAAAPVVRAMLERIRPELERLRMAGRRRVAKMDVQWQKGMSMEMPHLAQVRLICRVIGSSVRIRLADGNIDGAIDDIETALQIAVDLANAPGVISMLVGIACVNIAVVDVPELLFVASPAQRERLAKLAGATDAQFPSLAFSLDAERALSNETLRMCIETGGSLADIGTSAPIAIAWRQGFSLKIIASEVDIESQRAAEEARKAGEVPWLQAQELLRESEERVENSGNPLLTLLFVSWAPAEKSTRTLRAKLRLICGAVLQLDGGGVKDPAWPKDPFTLGPLNVRADPGKVVLWSALAGGPGTGTGIWNGPEDADDLVIEVKTK